MYRLRIEKQVQKTLEKINEPYYSKIKIAILNLTTEPRPAGCKKLVNKDCYRIRVGYYRIIYEILDNILQIDVIDLGH